MQGTCKNQIEQKLYPFCFVVGVLLDEWIHFSQPPHEDRGYDSRGRYFD